MPIWLIVLFILSIAIVWFCYFMYIISNHVVDVNKGILIGFPAMIFLFVIWLTLASSLPLEIDHVVTHTIHTTTGNSDKMYSYITTETDGDIIVTGIENRVYPEGKFIHKRFVYKKWYAGIYFFIPDKILIVQK